MNWFESINLAISILAVFVSIYSIHLTNLNKQKQQNLEKEMQNNEFKFSRRKVWYDKQNEVLDIMLTKLNEISSDFEDFRVLFEKEINIRENFTISDQEKVINVLESIQNKYNYVVTHQHYLPQKLDNNIDSIVNSIGHLIIKLDPDMDNNRPNKEEINKLISNISTNTKEMTIEMRKLFFD